MNIRSVTTCPKCAGDDLSREYRYEMLGEYIAVSCGDCGYSFRAECADVMTRGDGGDLPRVMQGTDKYQTFKG